MFHAEKRIRQLIEKGVSHVILHIEGYREHLYANLIGHSIVAGKEYFSDKEIKKRVFTEKTFKRRLPNGMIVGSGSGKSKEIKTKKKAREEMSPILQIYCSPTNPTPERKEEKAGFRRYGISSIYAIDEDAGKHCKLIGLE